MDKPLLLYCYDAYCGWCYGFSKVIQEISHQFSEKTEFEVLSGGMILPEHAKPIGAMAQYIREAYRTVEETTGIRFGQDYLWHIFNPDESDWIPCSEKPAIALSIFKEYHAEKQIAFAAELQFALHGEGRDLCDDEAYRHLLHAYGIPENEFYDKLKKEEYRDKAYYEFSLCKQLNVSGFPTVLLQTSPSQFYLLARGYTDLDTLQKRLNTVLLESEISNNKV
jgi:putative protein-disulfide isomerase